jgi:putative SbcD/Mre11-related phosphoesterase
MEIAKGMTVDGNALLIGKSLVIADLHFGQEESLSKKGVFVPRFQSKDIERLIIGLIEKWQPEELVITGDLKHEFGSILDTEWRNILHFFDKALSVCKRIVILKGNHDIMLQAIAKKKGIELLTSHSVCDTLLIHGDAIPDENLLKKCKAIVMGHEHPAITLRKENRAEKFKCFLKGKFKSKVLVVMPSFNTLTIGMDVLEGKMLSPLLKGSLDNFEVFVPSESEVLYFGKIKDLKPE